MINWDPYIGDLIKIFGEPVSYVPTDAPAIQITAVFDEAYAPVQFADGDVISARPVLGVQLSQFPAGYDPEAAQGDRFTVLRTGLTYVVKAGKTDSHGGARLEANLA